MRDYDVLLCDMEEAFEKERYEEAYEKAKEAVHRNRLNRTALFYLAVLSFETGNYRESYQFFQAVQHLQRLDEEKIVPDETLRENMAQAEQMEIERILNLPEEDRETESKKFLSIKSVGSAVRANMYASQKTVPDYFGEHDYYGNDYYFGAYGCRMIEAVPGGMLTKGEMYLKEYKGTTYHLQEKETPCILPIVQNVETNANDLHFYYKKSGLFWDDTISPVPKTYKHFRMMEETEIRSDQPVLIGKPIRLEHKEENKKLVLTIFIDSLNWQFFQTYPMEETMPKTWEFFQKGVICEQAYAGSEFTYASIPSYWTGMRPARHHMLDVRSNYDIPSELPLISEIFHDQGYMVSILGCNDSVVPNYGYIRGVDRFVFGNSPQFYHMDELVSETIDHLEAFGERDQFLWINSMDLHEVAGYWQPALGVECNFPAEIYAIDNIGGSSLYQTHSPHRQIIYRETLKRMDLYLGVLYEYIQKRYQKEDVIICLLSDHGNGFNVRDKEPFLSEQRENVPLMFYGAVRQAVCHEKIESIDYGHIISKLAGFSDSRLEKNDGQLPVFFGGEQEKEFAYAQSLHPDRYFENGIYFDDKCFYFKSWTKVTNECRIDLRKGRIRIRDREGRDLDVDSSELAGFREKCMRITEEMLGDYLL